MSEPPRQTMTPQTMTPQTISGLEEIRELMASGLRPPMMDLLGMELSSAEAGEVVFTATPTRAVYNPLGIVHGGFAATMLDSACGLAASSATPEPMDCVTLELKVAYHAPMREGVGPLRAIGRVVSMGSRVAHTEARLVDAADRLYATATSTLLVAQRRRAAG